MTRYETLKTSLEGAVRAAKAFNNYSMANALQAELNALVKAHRSHPPYADRELLNE